MSQVKIAIVIQFNLGDDKAGLSASNFAIANIQTLVFKYYKHLRPMYKMVNPVAP